MFCTKCAAENSDTATFCRKCGALLDKTEVETRVAPRREPAPAGIPFDLPQIIYPPSSYRPADVSEAPEHRIFSIGPTLIFVYAGYAAAALAAIFLVGATAAFTAISIAWAVLLGLLLFLIPAYYHVRQKLLRYSLTETRLEIDQGLFSRASKRIPINSIQDVTVVSGIGQRLLGFGDVLIDNASEQGGKVVLRNIDKPDYHSDLILRQIRRH